eukprot:1253339-Alexandrium_andersonii.AAC.1
MCIRDSLAASASVRADASRSLSASDRAAVVDREYAALPSPKRFRRSPGIDRPSLIRWAAT